MQNELVSVIIPCYNCEKYIEYTLKSVLDQSYQNFELIIVDDGSKDNSALIIKSFTDKRIIYIYQENKGLPAARNTGIKRAKGMYIAFLDSDDVWEKDKLSTQVFHLNKYDIIYCNYNTIDEYNVLFKQQGRPHYSPIVEKDPFIQGRNVLGSGSGVLMKKKIIDTVGLFNEELRYAEDQEYWTRIAWNGFKFYYVDKKLVNIRVHKQSIQATAKNDLILKNYTIVIETFLNFKNLDNKNKGLIYEYYFLILYSYSKNPKDLIMCFFKVLKFNYKLINFKHIYLLIKFFPRNILKKNE